MKYLKQIGSADEVEKELIYATLEQFKGNRTAAANSLKVSVRNLRNKLHRYRYMEYEHNLQPIDDSQELTPSERSSLRVRGLLNKRKPKTDWMTEGEIKKYENTKVEQHSYITGSTIDWFK